MRDENAAPEPLPAHPGPEARAHLLRRGGVQAALVALTAALLFAPALTGPFVYDDLVLVQENPWLRSLAGVGEAFRHGLFDFVSQGSSGGHYYRPLVHAVLAAAHAASGSAPWAYHLASLLLHVAASLGVWALARRLLPSSQREGAALVAGLLFAVHPVHVEAVAWVSGLMDLGATAAGLGMLWLLAVRALPLRRALAGALAWLVALLFKEVAITLPALLLVWDFTFPRAATGAVTGSDERRARLLRYGALLLAGAAYAVLRLNAVGPKISASGWGALPTPLVVLNALPLLAHHLSLLLWPATLSVFHDFEPATSLLDPRVLGGLLGLAVLGALFALRRRLPVVALGAAWLLLALLPALYLRSLGESAVSERYDYLPSVGFCLLVAGLGAHLTRDLRPAVRGLLAATLLLLAGLRSSAQLPTWQDEVALWENAVRADPEAPTPLYQLGAEQLRRGQWEDAQLFLEQAVQRRPEYLPAVRDLGLALLAQEKFREARGLMRGALARAPDQAAFHLILGRAERALGHRAEAEQALREAHRLNPSEVASRVELASLLTDAGRAAEALVLLREARALAPRFPALDAELARAQRALGSAAEPAPPQQR